MSVEQLLTALGGLSAVLVAFLTYRLGIKKATREQPVQDFVGVSSELNSWARLFQQQLVNEQDARRDQEHEFREREITLLGRIDECEARCASCEADHNDTKKSLAAMRRKLSELEKQINNG